MRNYNPVSINLTERMKEYNVKYCDTYEYNISKDIEMIQDFFLWFFCGGSVAEKGEEKKNGNGDNKSYLFSFI